jgi:hypothetical protein
MRLQALGPAIGLSSRVARDLRTEILRRDVACHVSELLARAGVSFGSPFDIPFIMSQLNNVPWAARVFIVSDVLIEISTYFPINKP